MATARPRSARPANAAPSSGDVGQADLLAHPRPSVAVDVAVLTVVPARADGSATGDPHPPIDRGADADGPLDLAVLLLRRATAPAEGRWGLPGSFVRERERLDAAVLRTLRDKCGIEGLAPRQLHTLDDPDRDDRGWVLSVAHVDVVRAEVLAAALAANRELWLARIGTDHHDPHAAAPPGLPVAEAPGVAAVTVALPGGQETLPFDHGVIVALAVHDLRTRHLDHPDPAGLAGAPDHTFTLLQLRRVHEAVLGRPLQKDTFRRQVVGELEPVPGALHRPVVGRPAQIYRRRPS